MSQNEDGFATGCPDAVTGRAGPGPAGSTSSRCYQVYSLDNMEGGPPLGWKGREDVESRSVGDRSWREGKGCRIGGG